MTPVERLQNALTSLGLKAVEARLEGLLEQAAKKHGVGVHFDHFDFASWD